MDTMENKKSGDNVTVARHKRRLIFDLIVMNNSFCSVHKILGAHIYFQSFVKQFPIIEYQIGRDPKGHLVQAFFAKTCSRQDSPALCPAES